MNWKEANHDEIWDDSALVDSWNEALDEYKKYHSVHAAGGAIEDIPGALKELETRWDAKPETTAHDDEPMEEEGERQDDSMPMSNETTTISDAQRSDAMKFDPRTTGHDGGQASKAGPESHPGSGPAAFGPQTLLGSVQDEEMKKLLMSWYYAGRVITRDFTREDSKECDRLNQRAKAQLLTAEQLASGNGGGHRSGGD